MNEKNFKVVYQIQAAVAALTAGSLGVVAPQQVPGFVAGVFLVTFEFYLLFLMWKRIFAKKPVATTVLIIITKYAVLGVVIFAIAKYGFGQLTAFFTGVTTLPASFLILAVKILISEKKKNAL